MSCKSAAVVMFRKERGHSEDVVAGIPEHCWCTTVVVSR